MSQHVQHHEGAFYYKLHYVTGNLFNDPAFISYLVIIHCLLYHYNRALLLTDLS